MAMSLKGLKDFGTNVQTPDELKDGVSVLIREHIFFLTSVGIVSGGAPLPIVRVECCDRQLFGSELRQVRRESRRTR